MTPTDTRKFSTSMKYWQGDSSKATFHQPQGKWPFIKKKKTHCGGKMCSVHHYLKCTQTMNKWFHFHYTFKTNSVYTKKRHLHCRWPGKKKGAATKIPIRNLVAKGIWILHEVKEHRVSADTDLERHLRHHWVKTGCSWMDIYKPWCA